MNRTQFLTDPGNALFLTDGGLETTLIFHKGIALPYFAAFPLIDDPWGSQVLKEYYLQYLKLARQFGTHFILESPTWRASTDWAYKLGYEQQELMALNQKAIEQLKALREEHQEAGRHILISGCVGPRGDGYKISQAMESEAAESYHRPQLQAFLESGADLATAITMNYVAEALGIARAAKNLGLPVVISFTLETDGHLPSGERLPVAIETLDRLTDAYPLYYMINCAHPSHFEQEMQQTGAWKSRIGGIRANASTKSHAELDESDSLDVGDKALLASGYQNLRLQLPRLKVIGGCCGTDHSHLEAICQVCL